jgi:hypothetical protein
MTKTLPEQSPTERNQESERKEGSLLEAIVLDNVMERLGQPLGNHRVQVRRVWGENYRVNVFVGADVASFTIAHSYFLLADRDGKILTCSPPIERVY